ESSYYLSLAEVFDKLGDYEKSFTYLKKGNDAKKKFVSASRAVEHQTASVKRTKAIYTKELIDELSGHGCQSDRPIFILGMPRSGTTLTEQIISSHPDVAPGGELTFLTKVKSYIDTDAPETLTAAGEEYIRLAQSFIGIDDKQKFTD